MPKPEDFTDLVQIGHGAFGTVYRARFIKRNKYFALKKMSKRQLQRKNMVSQINTEIKIMKQMKFDHIIRFYDCFEDDDNIYLILELAENGQLFDKLKKKGRFSEEETKVMIRDVVAAVEFLHSQKPPIIHRDIKPENILLDRNNRIKLADFGWSNFSNQSKPRKTYCGTLDYLAPEMIDQSGHDERLDIWCIGVLVYELLTGKTPFLGDGHHPSKNQIYKNILNVNIAFPENFPPMAQDFIFGMIKRNPEERMTLEEIKNHPWLKSSKELELIENQFNQPSEIKSIKTIADTTPQIKSAIVSGGNKEIIRKLNERIKQLQQENMNYRIKVKQNPTQNSDKEQINRLKGQISRLRAAQQLNEKYKKEINNLQMINNEKEKQLINLRIDMKRSQDQNSELDRIKVQKDSYVEKSKRLQKQIKNLMEKNRSLEEQLEEANSGIEQRVKNGERIMLAQASNPQYLTYLQEQILEMTKKFETSRYVFTQMLEKEKKNEKKEEELARLKSEEKKMEEIIKFKFREIYENQKDQILEKARLELEDERKKWLTEREELIASFEENGTSTEASIPNNHQQDLLGELRNIKQLNRAYEKTIEKQKSEIEDLKQDLKRKK